MIPKLASNISFYKLRVQLWYKFWTALNSSTLYYLKIFYLLSSALFICFLLETLISKAVLFSGFVRKKQICICHKDQKVQIEKLPGRRRQSLSLTQFRTPKITENLREAETGEASQSQRSPVLCKFKTTTSLCRHHLLLKSSHDNPCICLHSRFDQGPTLPASFTWNHWSVCQWAGLHMIHFSVRT